MTRRWRGPAATATARDDAATFTTYMSCRSDARDKVQAGLRQKGVGTGIHYPVPVHQQPAYAGRVALGAFGCSETVTAAQEF